MGAHPSLLVLRGAVVGAGPAGGDRVLQSRPRLPGGSIQPLAEPLLQFAAEPGHQRLLRTAALLLVSCGRVHRGRGLPVLPQPDAADPVAPLAHGEILRGVDRQPHLLPHAAHRRRHRQPRPAHRRRSRDVRGPHPQPVARSAVGRGHPVLLPGHPVGTLGRARIHLRRRGHARRGLHGVGRARLCNLRHVARACHRPAPRRTQFQPAEARGQLSLFPGALPRKRREHRDLSRRGRRDPQPAAALSRCDGQLVGHHAAAEKAQLVQYGLQPGRHHLPVPGGRSALLFRPDPAWWPDADGICIRAGAGRAVVVHHGLRAARRLESDGRSSHEFSRRHRARPRCERGPSWHHH